MPELCCKAPALSLANQRLGGPPRMTYLVLVLKGMAYGITHIVPGLGGGLVLILMGIYGQFVEALGNILVDWRRWRDYLSFLVPLGFGMVIGMVALSKIITVALDRYPAAAMFFFMGLLVGTIPPVLKMHSDMRLTPSRGLALVLGLLIVLGVKLASPRGDSSQEVADLGGYLYNGLVCFLAGGASVTPGLDGSYVLLLGGTYEPVVRAVGQLTELVIRWGALISTGIGAGLGIIVFSKLIDMAIKRVPAHAYYAVLGLIVGSVYGLWPDVPSRVGPPVLIVAFGAGVGIALLFGRGPAERSTDRAESVSSVA